MENFIRNLSMAVARQTPRRDFLRAMVGLGLGATVVFGNRPSAFAAAEKCTHIAGESCDPCRKEGIEYHVVNKVQTSCAKGGPPLCSAMTQPVTCGTTMANPCATGFTINSMWECCCAKKVKFCYVCRKENDSKVKCKCPINTSTGC